MPGPNQSPGINTYDPPTLRAPNLGDFNGASKQDDAGEPPDPSTMPNAPEDNCVKQTVVAMGQILPLLEVSITAGSTPAISAVLSPTSKVNNNPASLYVTRTGPGDYTIEVGNGGIQFPAFTGQPKAFINDITKSSGVIGVVYITGGHGNPAVHVKTYEGGSLADMNFTVQWR